MTMPEYIYVKYWRRRTVYVDGEPSGMTNTVLEVGEAGRHRIELSPPPNYCPSYQRPNVQLTTPQFPLELEFLHKSQQP